MALWQYTFHALPKESVDKFSTHLISNNIDGFDDIIFWADNAMNKNIFHCINDILPKGKSWCNEIDLYGDQESNCLEVLFERDIVESVSFRIDFTSNYEFVLSQLIQFFILNGFVIVDEGINMLPLNFEVIKSVIEQSSQAKMYSVFSSK